MGYTGSVDLVSGIRPKNNGTFPLVDAKDVRVDDNTRLNTALSNVNIEIGKAVRYDSDQSLTDAQKTTARTNVGAASQSDLENLKVVRYDTAQSLTDAQKQQARENIGAGEVDDTLSVEGMAADAKKTGDEIADLKGNLEVFKAFEENTGDVSWNLWEKGSINSSGVEVNSNYYIRSRGFIPQNVTVISLTQESAQTYVITAYWYTDSGTYIGGTAFVSEMDVTSYKHTHPTADKLRIVLRRVDSGTIDPDVSIHIQLTYQKYAIDDEQLALKSIINTYSAPLSSDFPPIKEIYLSGFNAEKNLIIHRVCKNLLANEKYVTGIYLCYDDDLNTFVARYYLEATSSVDFSENTVVPISQVGSTGISGYILIDFTEIDDGYDNRRIDLKINSDRVKYLEYSPIISEYVYGGIVTPDDINDVDRNIRKQYSYTFSDFVIDGYIDFNNNTLEDRVTGYKRTEILHLLKDDVIRAKLYSSSTKAGIIIWGNVRHENVIHKTNNDRPSNFIVYKMPSDGYVVFSSSDSANTEVEIYRAGQYPDIVYHNLDKVSLMSQAKMSRSNHFPSQHKPLCFIHFSDIHRAPWNWERLCDFIDYHSDKIDFALHTGDYVGAHVQSYDDHYGTKYTLNTPILNCVGNHDVYGGSGQGALTAGKSTTYHILFEGAHTEGWGCTFGSNQYDMYYYKDVPDTGIRLIVIDQYYWDSNESAWLTDVLSDAKTNGLYVITATHAALGALTTINSTFFSSENWISDVPDSDGHSIEIENIILDFVNGGGVHVCHLCGHWHHDKIGTTPNGILTSVVETASGVDPRQSVETTEYDDSARTPFEKCWDAANYMSIDKELGILKIVRIGCNSSARLQPRNVLSYDFINKQLIANY